jgi:rhamnogalacturonyl hydrolase YesR
MNSPLSIIQRIGDKLIRDTPFQYRLETAPVNHSFSNETIGGMQFVDFGRTFGLGRPAVAYAWTQLVAPCDQELTIQVEHNDGCKIWLNGQVVYEKQGDRKIKLVFDERSVEMSNECQLNLRQGANSLLVKSETHGEEWCFYLQPPSLKGAVVAGKTKPPQIGLQAVKNIDAKVAALTNWLVVGPFENSRRDLDAVHAPEREFSFGRMYPGLDGLVTWTIPKIEVHGAIIGWQPWGSLYHWSYYNGGTAWAMQQLAEATGEPKYQEYANRFCDYHLEGIPFVEYQVKTLNAVNSANHFIIESPLLDFTLAPSLPFIHRLRAEKHFNNREIYAKWIARMIDYARTGQVRLPGYDIYTRLTPVQYTTWVDDMFMGIPFLIQAALYVQDEPTRREFFDDAAGQTLMFNTQVWDEAAQLYVHARGFGSVGKLPHWSRCNGWAIWAMSEVLLHLPKTHPQYSAILEHYRRHVRSLVKFQNTDGFWLNVLDRPDSRPEVSGTAIFTMAIARGVVQGWLAVEEFASVAIQGWRALETQIEPDGTVHNICEGTMCSEDVTFYMERPFYDNDTHGLFAVLFAGLEMQKLFASLPQKTGEDHRKPSLFAGSERARISCAA